MDALRFPAGVRKTTEQFQDLRSWLHENGRVARKLPNGEYDPSDCTASSHTPGRETDDDLSIVRDTENNRVYYSVMPDLGKGGRKFDDPMKFERRFVQLDHEPTPFPESLAEWLVTV